MKSVTCSRDERLRQLQPTVRRMAYQMKQHLPPSVDIDDLVQAGMMGLVDAMGRFVAGGVELESYSYARIKGAMIDELRAVDWASRSCRRSHRRVEAASSRLLHRFFRSPTDAELATDLGVSIQQLQADKYDAERAHIAYLEDLDAPAGEVSPDGVMNELSGDPLSLLEKSRQCGSLNRGLNGLSERKQAVLRMHYFEEMGLKAIGEVLGVSESRVCQLHREALNDLRGALDATL